MPLRVKATLMRYATPQGAATARGSVIASVPCAGDARPAGEVSSNDPGARPPVHVRPPSLDCATPVVASAAARYVDRAGSIGLPSSRAMNRLIAAPARANGLPPTPASLLMTTDR